MATKQNESTLPEQHTSISEDRTAIAPYNFVPLPQTIVPAEESAATVRHDIYDDECHTGHITCTLTTESPLYVRCGYTPEDFADHGTKAFHELSDEQKEQRAQFFHTRDREQPVIPGSSLRGMLRALVEIAGYGKMNRVTDKPRYFFRAVAAPKKEDPLASVYEATMGKYGRNVRAGYLKREGNHWYIRPAKKIKGGSFFKIKEWDKKAECDRIPRSLKFTRLNEKDYRPQYVPCSFTTRPSKDEVQINQIGPRNSVAGGQDGCLVTSGNMLETNDVDRGAESPRTAHVVVPTAVEPDRLAIDPQAVEDYRASLTDFQKEPPFDPQWGALIEDRPIFYCEPIKGQSVIYFGHSPNFRIPYRPEGQSRAATPRDFVPEDLRRDTDIDLAEAIFGFVRDDRQRDDRLQTRAGRVFVSDAIATRFKWLSDAPITPHILASPKPTTFQHYLVQSEPAKSWLKHYGSKPGEETVIRGHKLYWHKGKNPNITLSQEEQRKTSDTQKTALKPVDRQSEFTFTIHFENLSNVELGALLWILDLTDDEKQNQQGSKKYRLKLGMGKPLGLGAVKLDHALCLTSRTNRYLGLFIPTDEGGLKWDVGSKSDTSAGKVHSECTNDFNDYVLRESGEPRPDSGQLKDTLRIQMLLALLTWPGPQDVEHHTRYMAIEREREPRMGRDPNEFKDRRVLPRPREVLQASDEKKGTTSSQSKRNRQRSS